MSADDVEILRRAHALFGGNTADPVFGVPPLPRPPAQPAAGRMAIAYRAEALTRLDRLRKTRAVDARLAHIMAEAYRDHSEGRRLTAAVLAAARSDVGFHPDNPIAARERLRRRLTRLRQQHAHVSTARSRARRHRYALRGLRYRPHPASGLDSRAVLAVRAALSRLGSPYIWGATGPDRFDCSGLVQWSFAQAGVRLRRTTYEQIHDGVPVAPAQVRPGDLVFPHAGHVQIAIGGGRVIEAPQPGSVVQISPMGPSVAIRRMLPAG